MGEVERRQIRSNHRQQTALDAIPESTAPHAREVLTDSRIIASVAQQLAVRNLRVADRFVLHDANHPLDPTGKVT